MIVSSNLINYKRASTQAIPTSIVPTCFWVEPWAFAAAQWQVGRCSKVLMTRSIFLWWARPIWGGSLMYNIPTWVCSECSTCNMEALLVRDELLNLVQVVWAKSGWSVGVTRCTAANATRTHKRLSKYGSWCLLFSALLCLHQFRVHVHIRFQPHCFLTSPM